MAMKHYKPFTDVIYGIVEYASVFVNEGRFYPSLTFESISAAIQRWSNTKLFTAVTRGFVE